MGANVRYYSIQFSSLKYLYSFSYAFRQPGVACTDRRPGIRPPWGRQCGTCYTEHRGWESDWEGGRRQKGTAVFFRMPGRWGCAAALFFLGAGRPVPSPAGSNGRDTTDGGRFGRCASQVGYLWRPGVQGFRPLLILRFLRSGSGLFALFAPLLPVPPAPPKFLSVLGPRLETQQPDQIAGLG